MLFKNRLASVAAPEGEDGREDKDSADGAKGCAYGGGIREERVPGSGR